MCSGRSRAEAKAKALALIAYADSTRPRSQKQLAAACRRAVGCASCVCRWRREKFLFLGDKYEDRPLEPQYLLIYGRESEFGFGGGHANPGGLRYKRDQQRGADESFMTFDSLRPRFGHSNSMTLTMTARGPEIHAFSPVYGTTTFVGAGALLLGDPDDALSRSVMISEERRVYLANRWSYWQQHERQENADPGRVYIRQTGIE
jgi:hypothetical protein